MQPSDGNSRPPRVGGRAFARTGLILLFLLALPLGAAAEIFVSPPTLEILMNPGGMDQGTIFIKNKNASQTYVEATTTSYADYARGDRRARSLEWLRLTPETFILDPGQETRVAYQINLADTAAGEVMGLVFFKDIPRSGGSGMVQGRVGVTFYCVVNGTLRPRVSTGSLRLVRNPSKGDKLYLELINNGNFHLRPRAEIDILDADSRCLSTVSFPAGWPILPGGAHKYYTSAVDTALPAGRYTARCRIMAAVPGLTSLAPEQEIMTVPGPGVGTVEILNKTEIPFVIGD